MKRRTWDWLITALRHLGDRPAIILGEFNTAPGDSPKTCGDHLPARVDAARYHVAGREIVDIQNGEEGRHAVAVDEAFVAAKCWKRWRWGRRW
jgi:hypothetical protein